METYFLVLVALVLVFAAWMSWRAHVLVVTSLKLLAARSMTDFAKGERMLAHGAEPQTKKPVGDGYTSVFDN